MLKPLNNRGIIVAGSVFFFFFRLYSITCFFVEFIF
jgi:hypothetical protein